MPLKEVCLPHVKLIRTRIRASTTSAPELAPIPPPPSFVAPSNEWELRLMETKSRTHHSWLPPKQLHGSIGHGGLSCEGHTFGTRPRHWFRWRGRRLAPLLLPPPPSSAAPSNRATHTTR
ncbi:hypothetical protein Vretifemale_13201 [Volvox reticuliferus]|uniref:Uncharacterized protein n=1 Tax=Volvox reticuliferus TaxID=1737510 RepID=A0A8J4CMR2_9CHLO|nr:hypothetical protein Vretifemale_13201 [Volvox reticuliferus]